ncbi:hypothetical protein E2562_015021 [Oryza meyeriana var. granulata]|uniref:Uncharacterized protein n=1 Tax=Oryza meyeriana var. granulata TaxID=110450 RepID=A0A6G1ELR0_9ORYZ|nr:hypothetical protein E2562_015021 [Oryza meyeriana var. granulata]
MADDDVPPAASTDGAQDGTPRPPSRRPEHHADDLTGALRVLRYLGFGLLFAGTTTTATATADDDTNERVRRTYCRAQGF